MPEADFIPGIDTTALTEVSGAQMYSLIRDALPEDNRGGVIYSATTPDVVTNPHLVRYIWVDLNGKNADSQPPFVARVWNTVTSGWDPLTIALATVTGDDIEDGSIDPVTKLSAEGLADGLILLTNTEDWQTISLIDAIAAGALPLNKLVGGSAGQVLYDNGSYRLWKTLSFGDLDFEDGVMPTEKLGKPGSETYLLAGDPDDGLKVKWRAFTDVVTRALILSIFASDKFPWSHISKGGANQLPIMDSTGVNWGFINKSELAGQITVEEYTRDFNEFVTTDNEYYQVGHGLGQTPQLINLSLKCKDNANFSGYTVGDEVSISGFTTLSTDDFIPLSVTADTSQITLMGYVTVSDFNLRRKSSAQVFDLFTAAQYQYWDIVIRVIKITS